MIDPQQLIIGAYVSLGGQIKRVHTIEPYPFGGPYRINANYISSDLRPIPITEQWLLDLGFEYMEGESFGYEIFLKSGFNSDLWLGCNGKFCQWSIAEKERDTEKIGLVININQSTMYVHQLQLLFYGLTGELLTKKQ